MVASSSQNSVARLELTEEQFAKVRALLAGYAGVALDPPQCRALEAAIARRLAARNEALAHYLDQLAAPSGRAEWQCLTELVLNHETFFFRNQPQLRALSDVLLPEIHRRKPAGEPIRIWSAGCSSGEEAYSLAIVAHETLGQLARPVEIIATDLSSVALARARAGTYRGRALRHVSAERLRRFFLPSPDGYAIEESLRALVRFVAHNLLEPFPAELRDVDVIFCQNVMIYFEADTRRELVARFHRVLADGGLLFLGFSETLWSVSEAFEVREVAQAYVYVRRPAPIDQIRRPEPAERQLSAIRPPAPRRSGLRPTAAEDDRPQLVTPYEQAASLVELARACADRGELATAADEIMHALALDPLNVEAHTLLGIIYGREQQWRQAATALERARYLSPQAPLISFYLADAYRSAGQAGRAAREYRSTLSKLAGHAQHALIDGVAVRWLRDTCELQLRQLQRTAGEE